MAASLASLLASCRDAYSDSTSKPNALSKEDSNAFTSRTYPGSLDRNPLSHPFLFKYRSLLDVDDPPSLHPITVEQEQPMESGVSEKPSQVSRKHSNDWADILCFYTAANGVASGAPTRTSPAPNGKAMSPPAQQEVPQSVSSTDPKIAAQQASDMRNIVRRKLTGYVGFANLPNQWHRKSVRKGFNFNVMVVGKHFLSIS